ncbi:MAG: hypothetical protein K0R00_114 [Herbinix sp.]|jgi:hypothetical protein|nr:hypothetical protein [Herbinix sp.]
MDKTTELEQKIYKEALISRKIYNEIYDMTDGDPNDYDPLYNKAQELIESHPDYTNSKKEKQLNLKTQDAKTKGMAVGLLPGTAIGMTPMFLSKKKYPGAGLGFVLPMAGMTAGMAVGSKIGDNIAKNTKDYQENYSKTKGSTERLENDVINEVRQIYKNNLEKKASEEKPNIVFDFDGVIHSYKSGWEGNNIIPDEPVPGIKEAIQDLRKDHKVIVVSTRCAEPGGIDAIKKYLQENDIEVDDVTDKKPPAIAYVDDNGINFDGDASTLPEKVRGFKSWLKKAEMYEEEILKTAEEQFMYHASRVQDIKKFRKSEDTSGNNKGKVIFVSKDPSFAAAFGARWNDGNARFVVETSNKDVPDESNYKGTRLEYTDAVNLDKPCSMYKLKGSFKPLRYDNDIEHYTDKDVDIISEEHFKTFRDMAKHYDVALKKVSPGHIMEQLKCKKSSNFEKAASAREDDQVGKDGKIPAIEAALSDDIARKVATMMATSHEYKTPNVDGALAMAKNYKWEKTTEKIKNLQGINKPIKQEKVLSIAEGIQKDKGKVEPFIIVNQLNGIRPQTPGKKILFDGHHRMEASKLLLMEEVPVYKGTYTGGAQKSKSELRGADKTAAYIDKIAMYEEGIYKAAKKDEDNDNENAVAAATAITGAAVTKHQLDRGNLTGREKMYHNTHRNNVDSILERGLDASKALDEDNITSQVRLSKEQQANKVYFGRKKMVADSVGNVYAQREAMKTNPAGWVFSDPIEQAKKIQEEAKKRKTLKASVPSWKLKEVDNPELRGTRDFSEYLSEVRKLDPNADNIKSLYRMNYNNIGRKNTAVFEGSVGPEVFKDSKNYKKLGGKEILDYIKNNPKRFGKGMGLSLLGIGGVAAGGAVIAKNIHDKE